MAMVTSCPHCATSFNVEPQVLLSRNGRVRCGKCKQIFDGLLTAVTLEEFQTKTGSGAADTTSVTPSPATVSAAVPAAAPEAYWPALPETPEVPVPPMPLEIAAAAAAGYQPEEPVEQDAPRQEAPFEAMPIAKPEPAPAPTHAMNEESFSEYDEAAPPPTPSRARWPWAVAATLAGLMLAGQVLYRYRSELAAHVPAVKPVLAQVCAWAGCGVPPLQLPASLNIEASDLQVVDKARPHLVQLTATVRNRAAIDVGYPALDLVLTDNREHALARRVIVPADYLPGPGAAQAAIAANAEVTVRVDLDTSGLPAAGFRLNLMQAPNP